MIDHEMRLKIKIGMFSYRLDHYGADRNVRDKMPVHHVQVQTRASCPFYFFNLFAEIRKIGREY
jgi:hypothetical protein